MIRNCLQGARREVPSEFHLFHSFGACYPCELQRILLHIASMALMLHALTPGSWLFMQPCWIGFNRQWHMGIFLACLLLKATVWMLWTRAVGFESM